jgi:trimeric autotransporter adhesin
MSTKTISKRVALATVVALGAGVLSLVSVSSASATNNVAAGAGSQPAAAAGVLNIASASATSGTLVNTDPTLSQSAGLLSVSDIAGGLTAGTTQTATLLSTGTLTVYTSTISNLNSNAGNVAAITVSGGTISGAFKASTAGSDGLSAGLTTVVFDNALGSLGQAYIKPASGVTSMVVSLYTGNTTTYSSAAAALASPTLGTLSGQIVVTVVASNAGGVVSTAKSGVWYTDGANANGSRTLTSDFQLPSGASLGTTTTGALQSANIRVLDAYGVAVTGGLLQVSATNGALVALGTSTSSAAPTSVTGLFSTAFSASLNDNAYLTVGAPSAAPLSTVVTVTYNGVVVGTKSFTFTGNVAKVILSGAVNGKTAATTSNTATIAFQDAAGNTVYLAGNTPAYGLVANSSVSGAATAAALLTAPASGTTGKASFTCGSVAGSGTIGFSYTNLDGTVITSNALPVTCSGKATNYSAAYDKASYKPGDIATLVITFKDSKGNLANDADLPALTTYGTVSTAGTSATITGPSSTNHYSDVLSNGVLTYKYAVGLTDGAFTNPVVFADVDANAKAAGLSASVVAPTLTISSGSTSLNDVLKGIVSLIASINKQIAALAKLVSKK